jgi:hypothetical protein
LPRLRKNKRRKPTIMDIDLTKHLGNWIIAINCPYCGEWYETILRLYHEGSCPAPLVHQTNSEKHILDVVDLRAENWVQIEIETTRRDNGEKVIFRGNLSGRFYRFNR